MIRKILFLIGFHSIISFAQVAEKIDLNPLDPYDTSYPHSFINAGDAIVFVSASCEHGTELWRYYGNGDIKVFDLREGEPSSNPDFFVNVNNDIYFRADTSSSSSSKQLFVYDHALDSVYKIAPSGWRAPTNLIEHNSKLYCSLSNTILGKELWEITLSTSAQLTDNLISTITMNPVSTPMGVCFKGSDAQGQEPWLYNGSIALMISDISAGATNSDPTNFIFVNDTLYFVANDGVYGSELWKFDGTTSTLVGDINPSGSSGIGNCFTDGSRLFFSASDPINGNELRVVNNGVITTFDINPGASASDPINFVEFAGAVFFLANNGVNGRELWKYEAGSVSMIADINPGSANGPFANTNFLIVGSNLYFIALNNSFNQGIWRTDGTTVAMEADFPLNSAISNFRYLNGTFCFIANDISGQSQLWEYDGVNYNYEDINSSGGSIPSTLVQISDTIYFGAKNGVDGIEPYKYDGSVATFMGNTDEYSLGVYFQRLDTLNGEMYFLIGNTNPNYWLFDGQSISQITDTTLGFSVSDGDYINYWNGTENVILFKASAVGYGSELWAFNGSTVSQLMDIWPGTGNGYPDDFLVYNDEVLFSAQEPSTANELWKYDGTTVSLLADINPTGGSLPVLGLIYDNKVYLSANNGTEGRELWMYDGMSCSMVADINMGPGSSNPQVHCIYDNKLIFSANDGVNGVELFSWDGSMVSLLADINPGPGSSDSEIFIEYSGKLYFEANDGIHGKELWSYSTSGGAQFVADINSGSGDSFFGHENKTIFNSKLVFYASDGLGLKLFEFDGNLVSYAGSLQSNIKVSYGTQLLEFQNSLFFTVDADPYYPLYRYNGYNLVPVETDDSVEHMFLGWIYDDILYGSAGYYCEENYFTDELWKIDDNFCPPQFSGIDDTACESYTFDGSLLDQNGTYYLTNIGSNGCDSITTLELVIHPAHETTLNVSACESYEYNGDIFVNSTIQDYIFTNQFGCDSTETLNLIIYQPQESFIYIEGCDSVEYNNQWYSTTGAYSSTLTDVHGCDSIVHINAVVHLADPDIVQLDQVLYAMPGIIGQYQWLDCSNGFAAIPGENDDQFEPSATGSYAVEITLNNCPDTSECFSFVIDDSGLDENGGDQWKSVMLNQILFVTTTVAGVKTLKIYDQIGNIVYTTKFSEQNVEVGVGYFATGIYTIHLQTEYGSWVEKSYFRGN